MSSDILSGSPYLLAGPQAAALLDESKKQEEQVALLRRNGTLDDATLLALRKEWNVEQVYESAGIEGNTLTLNETRLAISRGITISGKPPEHVDEVVQLHEAHEYLEALIRDQNGLTKRDLLDIHALVLGRGTHGSGEYRSVEVAIGNQKHKPPLPLKVPELMEQYFQWLTAAEPSCPAPLLATIAHAWLVHIHPFRDGNGRTARAVMNLVLMRGGFPVVIIRRKDRQRYYDALAMSDDGDIGPLLELFVARASDSLRQIDRVRRAAAGVSIEMERIAVAEQRAVSLWNAAVDLLCEETASAFQQLADRDASFKFEWRRFDPMEVEDYRALSNQQPVTQTWLAKFRVSRGRQSFSFLFWAGFASYSMSLFSKGKPVIFVSEKNPSGFPQWRAPQQDSPTTVREIAYADGRFWVRREGAQPIQEDSMTEFSLSMVQEVLRVGFA